jgi:hypothetical protein
MNTHTHRLRRYVMAITVAATPFAIVFAMVGPRLIRGGMTY